MDLFCGFFSKFLLWTLCSGHFSYKTHTEGCACASFIVSSTRHYEPVSPRSCVLVGAGASEGLLPFSQDCFSDGSSQDPLRPREDQSPRPACLPSQSSTPSGQPPPLCSPAGPSPLSTGRVAPSSKVSTAHWEPDLVLTACHSLAQDPLPPRERLGHRTTTSETNTWFPAGGGAQLGPPSPPLPQPLR